MGLKVKAVAHLAQVRVPKLEYIWLNYEGGGVVPASVLPAWLVGLLLAPGLILGTSAATYLIGVFTGEGGIPPINGFVFWFGAIWAVASLVILAFLSTVRALILRGRQT